VAIVRESERQGVTVAQVAKQYGITETLAWTTQPQRQRQAPRCRAKDGHSHSMKLGSRGLQRWVSRCFGGREGVSSQSRTIEEAILLSSDPLSMPRASQLVVRRGCLSASSADRGT